MNLKFLLKLVVGMATPETFKSVKAVLGALAGIGRLKGDNGEDVTPEELDKLWDAARAEFRTLGDEARASNAAINAAGNGNG